jgi:alanyl-tRNA synthetase
MKAAELKKKYLDFFVKKGHKILPNASLVPENDPSVLFTTAGMHPLVPYLLGEVHPLGKRLCSIQRCLRTDDIDNVGDGFHHTFFEMLGNWSLGDYWKEEALSWSLEFLTKVLGYQKDKISVSCFVGDQDAPKDEESAQIWQKLGIPKSRIYFLPKKDNWWGPAGLTGPCGPDSEMFIDTGKSKCSPKCDVSCQCGKYIEVWNDVFMQYNKTAEGKFIPLKQKNVDTGFGLERNTALTSGFGEDDYKTELFWPIMKYLEQRLSVKYNESSDITKSLRIIADHLKASIFLVSDGVTPSNKQQGYILRRLLRRSATKTFLIKKDFSSKDFRSLVRIITDIYPNYFEKDCANGIADVINHEIRRFRITLEKGLHRLDKSIRDKENLGLSVFNLFQSYGYPLELTMELLKEKGIEFTESDMDQYNEAEKSHVELSRTASAGMFKGGLADNSETVVKYHTATHLIHAALRKILGDQVHQVGSNLTAERLRFDFTWPEKLIPAQITKVQDLVNEKISQNLPVKMEIMSLDEAKKQGALAFFDQKYSDKVKVYSINDFSKEVCGGPHVKNTGEIGPIEIYKEESCGAGKRRLYAKIKDKLWA